VLALLNIFGVRRIGIYILVGMVLWTAVLKSGVHATLAGVIVGFFVPLNRRTANHRPNSWSMCCTRGWPL
jgi:Na+/H+ antiporter NhaA